MIKRKIEEDFALDHLVKVYEPLFSNYFEGLDEDQKRNLALLIDNETRYLKYLPEICLRETPTRTLEGVCSQYRKLIEKFPKVFAVQKPSWAFDVSDSTVPYLARTQPQDITEGGYPVHCEQAFEAYKKDHKDANPHNFYIFIFVTFILDDKKEWTMGYWSSDYLPSTLTPLEN